MKIANNNGIHAKSGRSVQHRIEDKSTLNYRTNSDAIAKKSAREIKSAANSQDSARKTENPVNPAREKYRRKVGINVDGSHKSVESTRTIQKRKTARSTPKKAVKRDLSRLHFNRNTPFKHKKLHLKKTKDKAAKSSGSGISKGLAVPLNVAKNAVTKPVEMAGNKLLSQRADFSKTEDTGIESVKLGLQTVDYARRGVRGIKSTVQAPRKIYKGVKRTANGTRRVIKTSARAAQNAAKAARAAAKATAKGARATVKITVKIAQAAAQAVAKIVSLIAETMPYSLIVLAVFVVILLMMYMVNMIMSSAGSSVGAIGGWAANSDTSTESDVYNNIQEFISEAKAVLEGNVQNPLKSEVDEFCALYYHDPGCSSRLDSNGGIEYYCDGHVKDNVLELKSDQNSVAYYPGRDGHSAVNGIIMNFGDQFDSEFYADFLATLYVLKAREMQRQNSSDSNVTIFDLKFASEDFAEIIQTVNENSCEYGDTYFYKTSEHTVGKCPNEDCRTQYKGDDCCSRTKPNGDVVYYCGGHPYCPGTHPKLIIELYSDEKYTSKNTEEIYGFSNEEKEQYKAVKEFIKAISDDIEGGESK